jgi:ligand-binding sensor domain-containing protein
MNGQEQLEILGCCNESEHHRSDDLPIDNTWLQSSSLQANQAMMQDRQGNIWFGGSETLGTVQSNNGIWRYDGVNFKNFTINDGLNGYSVWSMLEDSAGHVWIGTRNTGLTRFDGNRFETLSEN